MTPRERVLHAITRRQTDKTPKEAGFTPAAFERFREHTGSDDPAAYFRMEPRSVGFHPPAGLNDFSAYLQRLPEGARINSEYGTAEVPGDFYHFTHRVFPLQTANTVTEIEAYPWPDFTPSYRHTHLDAEVQRWHDAGYFVDAFAGHIFEVAWQLIGFEEMFEKMITNPPFVEAVFEHITKDNCFKARRMAEAGIDMLRLGDDVGMQDRLMMQPDMWRRYLKPRLGRVIQAARDVNPSIPVWYHSDGDISLIIDDLIEVGVTVLNPVQPECMDVYALQRQYSDRLAFWGTIGTQTVMPFGTPDDVRRTVREMIALFGPGLVLAPTHVLEPEVPWENIVAFFEAVEDH
ncbi:MAG: hypothetical protein HY710_11200 [Candidatus Latescibacteria bacterium]|nr:hypothetical protein [Candidatus Latescibacterota bacterium]